MKHLGFAGATCAAGALRKAAVKALPGQIIVRELKLKSVWQGARLRFTVGLELPHLT